MGNPFRKLADIKKTVTNVARMPQYNGRTNVMQNEERGTRNTRPEFTFTPYNIKPKRPGDVPINMAMGPQNQPKAAKQPIESKVPRERWIRDTTAQQQGPRQDGQRPGMTPYIGPYAGGSQRVPTFLDPKTNRYTPGSPSEYQTWLSGQAFGVGANPRSGTQRDVARALSGNELLGSGTNPYGQDLSNYQTPSYYSDEQKAAIQNWQSAMSGQYEDAVDRSAKRNTVTTLGGIGRSIADYAASVYGKLPRVPVADRRYDDIETIENIRVGKDAWKRGAPDDNVSEADAMPAYTGGSGYGGGGYGGGGWGGGGGGSYDPVTKRWLNAMANWRI